MIRKFAALARLRLVPALTFLVTILAGASLVRAQQTSTPQAQSQQPPAQPAPNTRQSSSSQEATQEEIGPRKTKPREYKSWTFNVGGGASLTSGSTKTFVRGGGGVGDVGVARNYSKYFGLRADFQFDNLPLRNTALQQAQASGASSHAYSLMIGPIINIPVTKNWGGYVLIGGSYFHRSGKLDSSTALPGAGCNPFFTWWGNCYGTSLPLNGKFLSESLDQFGYNLGGGVTRKIRPNVELYGEFRFMHGTHSGITTDLRPITIGVRW